MIKKTFLKSFLLLLCMIVGGASSAWADEVTYTFTSKSWAATCNDVSANWTSGKDGSQLTSGQGIQVTTGVSGANGTSPVSYSNISKIVVNYCTNASKGAGTIKVKVGCGTEKSFSVTKPSSGGTTLKAATFNFSPAETGNVKITAECSTNSVYIHSVTITYNPAIAVTGVTLNESSANLKVGETLDLTATVAPANATNKNVSWSSSAPSVASVENGTVTAVSPGDAEITVTTEDGSKTATCAVKVVAADAVMPPTFSVADGASLELGSSVTITASEGCTLKYQIGDGEKTSVDANTKELALNTVGYVTLTAWSVKDANESDPAQITLTVTRHPISLSFSPDAVSVVRGGNVDAPALSGNTGSGEVTYSSADEKIATVNSSTGVVTGVAIGSTTITATIAATDTYLGNTATFTVNVTKPFHTVTFSVNDDNTRTASVQEDAAITFPTAVENPSDDSEFEKEINGMTFVGWYGDTYTDATVAPAYVNTSTTTMGTSDVTYYAVYADTEEVESDELEDCVLGQTLQYDSWTYSGTTTNKTSYRLFGEDAYIESSAFDLSKLMKVIVYGGTFGGGEYNSLTIGDGTNTWKSVTVSGKSETGVNTYTGGTALTGTKALRITSNSGDGSNDGIRISKIEIFVKGMNVSHSNFCTTVSTHPRPVITMDDVEMTWGDTDASVAPTATVGEDAYEGEFTFTSSDAEKLTVAPDGKLTCNVPGTYTVTASIAATEDYQAASTTCTVTVNKKNISLSFANTEIVKMVTDETKTFTETATPDPAAYDGTISYAISGSGSATINTSTAQVSYTASTGVNTITATAPATDKYNGNSASYTLYVKTTPTITVSNQTLAYGETYEPSVTGGDVAITAVPNLITVDGGVITAAVVGTATVTVSTAANDTYVAGKETFTLTVTAPTALSAKPTPSPVTVFYESFDTNDGTGGNDGSWSGSIASSEFKADNTWNTTNAKGAKACAKFGTGSNGGSAMTPNIELEKDVVYTLTFKAGAWNKDGEGTSLSVSAINASIKNEANTASVSSVTTSKGSWTSYTLKLIVTDESDPVKITFSTDGGNKRFFLDEVKITKPGVDIATVPVTVSTSSYATYCSLYPLDLSTLDSKVKAYTVTAVTADAVTFTKITGTVKGGVPFILYGTPGDYNLTVADESTAVPAVNNLSGTLAPTYLTQINGDYTNFALSASNGDFRLIPSSGMTFPANKAYLPVLTSVISGSSARLAIIFDDDQTTTIQGVSVRKVAPDTYYNMKGQRVDNPKKGGVYVKNGKKVIFK